MDFSESDECKPVLLGLSLAGNLVKQLLTLYGTEWRERGYGLWAFPIKAPISGLKKYQTFNIRPSTVHLRLSRTRYKFSDQKLLSDLIVRLSKVDFSTFFILNLIFFKQRQHFCGPEVGKIACDAAIAGVPVDANNPTCCQRPIIILLPLLSLLTLLWPMLLLLLAFLGSQLL